MEAAVCHRREPKCITPCSYLGLSQLWKPARATPRGQGQHANHSLSSLLQLQSACPSQGTSKHPGPGHHRATKPPGLAADTHREATALAHLPSSEPMPKNHSEQRRGSFPLPPVPARSHLGHQQRLVSPSELLITPWGSVGPAGPCCRLVLPSLLSALPGEQHVLPCAVLQELGGPGWGSRQPFQIAAWKSFADHGGSSELPHAASAIPHGRLCANSAGASGHCCHRASH